MKKTLPLFAFLFLGLYSFIGKTQDASPSLVYFTQWDFNGNPSFGQLKLQAFAGASYIDALTVDITRDANNNITSTNYSSILTPYTSKSSVTVSGNQREYLVERAPAGSSVFEPSVKEIYFSNGVTDTAVQRFTYDTTSVQFVLTDRATFEFTSFGGLKKIVDYSWDATNNKWEISGEDVRYYNSSELPINDSSFNYNAGVKTLSEYAVYSNTATQRNEVVIYQMDFVTNQFEQETKRTFIVDANGYTVEVEEEEWDSNDNTWDKEVKFILGNNLLSNVNSAVAKNNPYQVFPNPANDVVNFTFSQNLSDVNLSIYSIKGILIQQTTRGDLSIGSTIQVDIENLNPGIYLVKVSSNEAEFISKVQVK